MDIIQERIKVKLIVTEIAKTQREMTVRRLLSPITSTFGIAGELGFFHSALIVGPWILEWTNSSLCVPRKCQSSAAVIAVDLDDIKLSDKIILDKVIDSLAEKITYWNSNKIYSQSSCNCQHFVEEILQTLEFN